MNWTTLFKKFTNWKYIVWLLAITFLSIGSFTNAENFTVDCTAYVGCTPEIVYTWDTLQDANTICVPNLQEWVNVRVITEFDEYTTYYYDEMQSNNFCVPRTIKWIWFTPSNVNWEFTFNVIWWWLIDSTTNNNWWNIVEWWASNFTPIIAKLGNIAGEFIPYMIYIAIACLWVTLAFKALKYIIWYIQSKAKWAVRWK